MKEEIIEMIEEIENKKVLIIIHTYLKKIRRRL